MDKEARMNYNGTKHALIAQHQSGPLPREDAGEAPAGRTNTVRQHGLFYAKIVIYEGVLNDDWIEKSSDGKYKIIFFKYATPWSNTKHEITGENLDEVLAEYETQTSRLKSVQSDWESAMTTEELAREIDYTEMEEA